MFLLVFHQIFWTFLSFSMFYLLITFMLFPKLEKIKQNREQALKKIKDQINLTSKKKIALEKITYEILFEEIPNNEKFYIKAKLDPIIENLNFELLDQSNFLKSVLEKQKNHDYYKSLSKNDELKVFLNENANLFLEKVQN